MPIDLSALPPPDIVEELDYETLLAERTRLFLASVPAEKRAEMAATLALESEPITILLQENAYLQMVILQRINDAVRAVLLASADGTNLDHLAALLDVQRLQTDPGNPEAQPPVPPTYESDAALRARVQIAPEGFGAAGPSGAYRYHALSASGDIADIGITSPAPGRVMVTVLANDGDGTPSAELLETVSTALTAEDVRPLTDDVVVVAARIVPYTIAAQLVLYPGPAAVPVLAAARAAAEEHARQMHRIGHDITLSAVYAALHIQGVQRVALASPAEDIVCASAEAPYCTGIEITLAGVTDV